MTTVLIRIVFRRLILEISGSAAAYSILEGSLYRPDTNVNLYQNNVRGLFYCFSATERLAFRMFETNPEVKRTFEKFRQLDTPSELWRSTVLETHGMVVMSTLDEIISGLDDDDENVAETIVDQGRSHARFSDDFDEQTFWVRDKFHHSER